jgi:hypothetical protein
MKHVVAIALVVALCGSSLSLAAAGRRDAGVGHATVSGLAKDQASQPLAQHTVRLRNLADGELSASTHTNAAGEYAFTNVTSGDYLIEVVDEAGTLVGTSTPVSVQAGDTISGVIVTAGAAQADLAATLGTATSGFFASTAGIVTLAAAGAGVVVTAAAVRKDASPSN